MAGSSSRAAAFYHGTKFAVEAISDAMRWEVRNFGVDVIVIEPGLIKTEFGETAAHSVNDAVPSEGPYAEFNQQVAATTAGAYEGRGTTGPDAVANRIEKVIFAQAPRGALPRDGWSASATGCGENCCPPAAGTR